MAEIKQRPRRANMPHPNSNAAQRARREKGTAQNPEPKTNSGTRRAVVVAPEPGDPSQFTGLPLLSLLDTADGDIAGLAKALQHEALSTLVATMRSPAAEPSERLRAAEQVAKWADGYAPKQDPTRKHLAMTDDQLLEFIKEAQAGMYEPAVLPSPSFEAMLAAQTTANEEADAAAIEDLL